MDTSKIHRYIWKGRSDINWYSDCEKMISDLYGRENRLLVARILAATSINSSMKSNVTLFKKAYAYYLSYPTDKPMPKMLPNIMKQLVQVYQGKPLTGLKINAFANAMGGDTQAVIVDIWHLRAFGLDKTYMRYTGPHAGKERSGGPTDKQFYMIEAWVREEAMIMGLQPRQLSAMIWSGTRETWHGKDKTHYKEILQEASLELFPRKYTGGFTAEEVIGGFKMLLKLRGVPIK
jgi:hypothetical protein